MKIFKGEESSWSKKVNFVDSNDVFVGYDTGQTCCEDAGYFIADKVTPYIYEDDANEGGVFDLEDYNFDKEFFEYVESSDLEEGGMVAFRLVCEGKPDLFLHLYNSHNGYYGHGFEVKHSGEVVKDEYL